MLTLVESADERCEQRHIFAREIGDGFVDLDRRRSSAQGDAAHEAEMIEARSLGGGGKPPPNLQTLTPEAADPGAITRTANAGQAITVAVPIVPGILPVSNVATTRRFAQACGAAIPVSLDDLFEGLDDLPSARQLIAATVAAELCGQLYAGGVRHFHFYTLNRAELSYAICHLLGVRAQRETRS